MTATSPGVASPEQTSRDAPIGGPTWGLFFPLSCHWKFVLGTAVATLIVVLWRSVQYYPTTLHDIYPLYYGAKAWLHGAGAYDLASVVPVEHQNTPLFRIGNLYPLPAVLIVLPLTLLPPTAAAMVWLGILVVALLIALRLNGWPAWLLIYLPVVNAIYAEQFTLFILVLQILAIWAYRTRRPWTLAFCCALILAKPSHGFFFVVALFLLSRHWRQFVTAGAVIWGSSLLLDPTWMGEWLAMLAQHQDGGQHPLVWGLALFAIPLFLVRDYIGGSIALQFLIMPYVEAAYPLSGMPLSVLDNPRHRWLVPISFLWILLHFAVSETWATALALMLPVVVLSVWQRRRALASLGMLARSRLRAVGGGG